MGQEDGGTAWFGRLVDLVDGRLPPREAREAETAAAADSRRAAALEWLRHFRQVAADVVVATPPDAVRSELLERFEATRTLRPVAPGPPRRLRAVLTFEGLAGPALAGARGAAGTAHADLQLVFSAAPADVAIDLTALPDDQVGVAGQVFPYDEEAAASTARVEHEGRAIVRARCDDLGEFDFGPLARRPLTVVVTLGVVELVLDLDPGGADAT